ncbi:MAG: DUF2927 domain-containing protein [Paracoccaceae bacterium]
MKRWVLLAFLSLALAACDLLVPVEPTLKPQSRPSGLNTDATVPSPRATSQASAEIRAYLTQVQSAQLTQGLLRRDGGGPDTPFTSDMLSRNFERIAFFNEYTGALSSGVSGALGRWDTPVRMEVIFGASIPPSQRRADKQDVAQFATRLSRVTKHPISVGPSANFLVLFVSEDDRPDEIDKLSGRFPNLTPAALAPLKNLSRETYCAVIAFGQMNNPASYSAAVAVIRAENPDLLRLSCIHEELSQGLGLANDSPQARPSIYNDDDEFALLTNHDELLLGMLYDKRLQTGMSLDAARPIIREISVELTEPDSPT